MALLIISLMLLMTNHMFNVIPGGESRHFPLPDCSRNQMDILALFVNNNRLNKYQNGLYNTFKNHILSFHDNTTYPRAQCFEVFDSRSAHNPVINVSTWNWNICIKGQHPQNNDTEGEYRPDKTVKEVLQSKIAFVKLLFSNVSGGRDNVTRVAVIFLSGTYLTFSDVRKIPKIIHQQKTDIKIFVVVLDVFHVKETIHLVDTLVLNCDTVSAKQIPTMAMCKECITGWFSFLHKNSSASLSCYKLSDLPIRKLNWLQAKDNCNRDGTPLAGIETQEELNKLREELKLQIKERGTNGSNNSSTDVFIGLRRNLSSIAKRFEWSLGQAANNRPLVINHWKNDRPFGGQNKDCGFWRFVVNDSKNGNNVSRSVDFVRDEWVAVACRSKLQALSLCEVVLPTRLRDRVRMRVKPASKSSFIKASRRRKFINYKSNIVSVSAYRSRKQFFNIVSPWLRSIPVFDCGEDNENDRYISYAFVCDNIDDCSNKRDETMCIFTSRDDISCRGHFNSYFYTDDCKGVTCCDGSCLPLQWVNDGEVDCTICEDNEDKDTDDETGFLNKYLKSNETCAFICDQDTCVHFSQLNDSRKICKQHGSFYEAIGKLVQSKTCKNILGKIIWAPKCVYVKDKLDAIMGCRDVSHLKGCTHFQCPVGYFKCPNSYCIPQHYVLDGKVDCPNGEEEQSYIFDSCSGNFKCWKSDVCLHPDLVCDGHPECPHRDDEIDCDDSCHEGFQCLSGTVTVSGYNRSVPLNNVTFIDSKTRYLDLYGVDLSKFTEFTALPFAVEIRLSNCNIYSLHFLFISHLVRIRTIDVSYNLINKFSLDESANSALGNTRRLNLSYNKRLSVVENLRLKHLVILDLSHTGLSFLNNSSLKGLPELRYLNLSYTFISHFHKSIFPSNFTLYVFDLRGMPIDNFYEDLFNGLTIRQHLYTDKFEICCPQNTRQNGPYYICHAPDDAISSCFNLVSVLVQRVLLWLVAVLAVLGNITVIVYRILWDRSVLKLGYGLFVTNLAISDFIMGVYLLIIAGADVYFRGIYVLHERIWRESMTCKLAGFLATLSIETSTFFIFLITLDRFLVIKFPFGQKKFSKASRVISLLLSWITGFLLAIVPVVFRFEIYSSNGMCLGLPLTAKQLNGWEYSFGMFIILNFIMFLIIAWGQIAIFRAVTSNRKNKSAKIMPSRRLEDIMVAKQLSLVVLSNFLFWFPVGLMGLMSLGKHEISNDVYGWTTVVLLPINAAVNPVLYTIHGLMVKWDKFRYGDTSTTRTFI